MKIISSLVISIALLAGSLFAASPAVAHNSNTHCSYEASYGQTVEYGSGLHRVYVTGGNHTDCAWIGYVYCYIDFWGSRSYTTRNTGWHTKKTNGWSSYYRSSCPYAWRAYHVQTTGYRIAH